MGGQKKQKGEERRGETEGERRGEEGREIKEEKERQRVRLSIVRDTRRYYKPRGGKEPSIRNMVSAIESSKTNKE